MSRITYRDSDYYIDGIKINYDVFNEYNLLEYSLQHKNDFEDDLIRWINESSNFSERYRMKEDLKSIMNREGDFIFIHNDTNYYVGEDEDEEKEYNEICDLILKLNKKYEEK